MKVHSHKNENHYKYELIENQSAGDLPQAAWFEDEIHLAEGLPDESPLPDEFENVTSYDIKA